jgi:hypothetical protein
VATLERIPAVRMRSLSSGGGLLIVVGARRSTGPHDRRQCHWRFDLQALPRTELARATSGGEDGDETVGLEMSHQGAVGDE